MCVLNATYQPSVEDLPEHGTLQIQIHTSDDQSPHAFQHYHRQKNIDWYLPYCINAELENFINLNIMHILIMDVTQKLRHNVVGNYSHEKFKVSFFTYLHVMGK